MIINDFNIKYIIFVIQCCPFISIRDIKNMLDPNLSDI